MINPIRTMVAVTLLSLVTAMTNQANAQNGSQTSDFLSEAKLQDLITTLESQTAREQFLERLRTLQAAQPEQEQDWSIREWFNLDSTSSDFVNGFVNLINELGLSSSMAGNLISLLLVLILAAIFVAINNRLATLFDRRMDSLRKKFSTAETRFSLIFRVQRIFGYIVAVLLLMYSATSFFPELAEIIDSQMLSSVIGFSFSLALLGLMLVLAWEFINAMMEYGMSDLSHTDSTRIRTLLPVVRNIAFFSICGFAALVLLSELGIDIVPLLAGAGVLGIAIGFGAQTLVKDYLNGFIIILENLLKVDDVVRIGDRIGQVELITLRKIQLRNLDGTVHTIPHSEISVVDNLTKEYTYYLTDIGVAYKEDVDEVFRILESVDKEMREDDEFKHMMLEPIQIFGLDEFADSALNIKVRLKTESHSRWPVGREFNRRVKIAFDEAGIEIPFPHRTVFMNPAEPEQSNSVNEEEKG
ncbi:MAG: mechanosensitive ion channel family protein [Pseudomonadales bacterium]|nr:mechanosensitive ion channel family protein [Pseudomonadales bacterium]